MKKILVVDDENLILYSLSAAFRDENTEVITANTGEAALKAIDGNSFDACFLDVNLPDMNGLDIMKKVRSVSPGTKIVIMTGSEVTDGMMSSIRENAHLLIDKPFDLHQVREFVDRALDTGRPLSQDEMSSIKDHASFVKWLADENRKNERRPTARSITCFAVPSRGDRTAVMLSGKILDISDDGMCIHIDCHLQPGSLLRICDAAVHCTGVVRWSANAGTADSFHAGIQFVSPESAVQ
jgi:CheY-like chemotaxis protein